MYAVKAKYHQSCRKKYLSKQAPDRWRSLNCNAVAKQSDMTQTHRKAFDCICKRVNEDIMISYEILKLTDLCNMYIEELKGTPFANPNYRAGHLKSKLEKHEPFK